MSLFLPAPVFERNDIMIFMHNTPPWVDSIRANFDYIAKKLLPASSADDNGKVLTVVDGEWAAAPASGGGGGLTLYGPYAFNIDEDSQQIVGAGDTGEFLFSVITDYNGDPRTLSGLPQDTLFIMSSYYSWIPIIEMGNPSWDGNENDFWPGSVKLLNTTNSSLTISEGDITVEYYATHELPLAE